MSCAAPAELRACPAPHSSALPRLTGVLGLHVNNSELTPVREYSYQHSLDNWDWEKIPADVDQVVIRWRALVHDRLPWCEMPADDGLGYMRAVVSELLNEARHPSDGMRERRLCLAARAHGEFRRRQHCHCGVLTDELAALGSAIESAMLDAGQSSGLVKDYRVLLDADVALVRTIAVDGWSLGAKR
jgi:hypothetical protein